MILFLHSYVILKKGIPKLFHFGTPIKELEKCRFKIAHSSPNQLNLRFTFFDKDDQPSVYKIQDIRDNALFKVVAVSADQHKTFPSLEIYSDKDVLFHLIIEQMQEVEEIG